MSSTLVTLLVLAAPAPAVTVADLGGEVGVVLRDLSVADGRLAVERDRIEIALATAVAPTSLEVADRVIKRIDVLADPPRVSIQTRYGPRTTARLARGGVLETLEGAVRVRLSRDIDRSEVSRSAPGPGVVINERALELPWAPVAAPAVVISASDPPPAIATAAAKPTLDAAAIDKSTPEAPPGSALAALPAAPRAPSAEAPRADAPPLRLTGLGRDDDDTTARAVTWAAVLALLAGAALLLRAAQRRRQAPDRGELTVLSSRALSPKVRVVLVGVAGRQLLLSVADKGAELLTEIATDEPAEAGLSPAERALARATTGFARARLEMPARATPATATPALPASHPATATEPPSSPAVSGLLALRARATGTDEIPRNAAWTQRVFGR